MDLKQVAAASPKRPLPHIIACELESRLNALLSKDFSIDHQLLILKSAFSELGHKYAIPERLSGKMRELEKRETGPFDRKSPLSDSF